MPPKGRRSQKVIWIKVDLAGQGSDGKGVAQYSDRQQADGGNYTPRILSVQASHCQSDTRYDVFLRNHQCTCVALTFLANQSEGIKFKMPDLDRVLGQCFVCRD